MSSSPRRVVVTGMGALCGLGNDIDSIWKKGLEGQSGITTIDYLVTKGLPITIGGQVLDFTLNPHLLPAKEVDRYDRFILFALQGALEALTMANLLESPSSTSLNFYSSPAVVVILGVGMGGFPFTEANVSLFLEKGHKRISPFFIPAIIPNMASGLVGLRFKTQGINYSISSACASSLHAIDASFQEIRYGRHECLITGGVESVLTTLPYSGFTSMKALSKGILGPEKSSRPFDKQRDGFVMGEGAGILILESLDSALARKAPIIAEIVGSGVSCDSYHITAPHEEGEGASRCMQQALSMAKALPNEIDYINAHGTSTPLGDVAETKAIKKTFGEHAYKLNISSTKSMTGHLLGAAGGIESIFCLKSLQENIIPPTINLEEAGEGCDLNYTPNKPVSRKIIYALNNSFGFGGTNASILFKKYVS